MKTVLYCVDNQRNRGIAPYFPIIAIYSDISLLRLLSKRLLSHFRISFVRLVNSM